MQQGIRCVHDLVTPPAYTDICKFSSLHTHASKSALHGGIVRKLSPRTGDSSFSDPPLNAVLTTVSTMTADSPAQPEVPPRRQQVAERTEDRTTPDAGTDQASRVGLTAKPEETLDLFRQMNARLLSEHIPAAFGNFDLSFSGSDLKGLLNPTVQNKGAARPDQVLPGASAPMDASRFRKGGDILPSDVSRVERTRISGTGARQDTQVEIRYGLDGKPSFVRDHLGEWKSDDGGNTWRTDGPNFRTRRGEVSIDGKGNYTFTNNDYGLKSTFSPDGNVTRTMTNAAGDNFTVTRNKQGVPIAFSDKNGEWTGDGKNWTNAKTGERKSGTVSLTEFGQFKFKPDGGTEQVEQTPQLERINKLQEEICKEFNVLFAKPGEWMPNDDRDKSKPETAKLHAGVPTEAELKVLQEVLRNTNHEDYKGMKMWFIRPDENNATSYAHYEGTTKDGPHNAGSCACHSNGARQDARNGELTILPLTRQHLNGFTGVEGVLYHELGHHEQRLGIGEDDITSPKASREGRQIAAAMGWAWSKKHGDVFLDKNNNPWKYNETKDKWDWAGAKPPKDGVTTITKKQMRDRAKVTPMTSYNDSPLETHAEAVSAFRLGETGNPKEVGDRRLLAITSPQLYEAIKKYDQDMINKTHKPGPDGKPTHIRGLNGRIIENTAENQRTIADRENVWRMEREAQPPKTRKRGS